MTTRPLQSNLELGALPSAVACARLHAKQVAWEWGLEALTDTVELVVSELATNAIRAAVSTYDPEQMLGIPYIWLRLTGGEDQVLIEVWDGSLEPPMRAETDLTTEHGRGLLLVEAVSVNWGYYNMTPDPPPSELSATVSDWGLASYEPTSRYEPASQYEAGSRYGAAPQYEAAPRYEAAPPYEPASGCEVAPQYERASRYAPASHYEPASQYEAASRYGQASQYGPGPQQPPAARRMPPAPEPAAPAGKVVWALCAVTPGHGITS